MWIIDLAEFSVLAELGSQLERRLEAIYIKVSTLIKMGEGLTGHHTREPSISHETANNGTVFLLDPGLIVLVIRPGSCEFDLIAPAKRQQSFIYKGSVIIGIDA